MTNAKVRSLALRRTCFAAGAALAALISSLACGGGGGSSSTPAANPVDSYVASLQDWSTYSPTLPDEPAHAVGDPGPAAIVTGQDPQTQEQIDFRCVTTPYKIQDTPEELIVFDAPEVLWPGALLQGSSFKRAVTADGPNAVLPLTIAERTPIKVSIPALMTSGNFREVVPSQATVANAIGEMIGAATTADVHTGSSPTFNVVNHDTDVQVALETMGQAKFPLEGIPIKAGGSFDLGVAYDKTTIVAHYREKMFEAVVAPPQTPSAFFSSEFTQAKLDEQVQLGRIGPDNLPLYVSSVGYGRMFIFKLQSSKTSVELEWAMTAGIDLAKVGFDASVAAKVQAILAGSDIRIATVGGPFEANAAMIKSGDWRPYFDVTPRLDTAVPISYVFRSLKDNTVAKVTEFTTYGHRVCTPVLKPGFRPRQPVDVGIAAPFRTSSGDLNGDGRTDLVWNHLGTTNEVRVGFGQVDGTFDVTTTGATTIAASPAGGWAAFDLVVADVDGDGREDLVWNRTTAGKSETWVARSLGDGTAASPWTLELLPLAERSEPEWAAGFALAPARVTTKAGVEPTQRDLLWSLVTGAGNTVSASVWGGTTPTALPPKALATPPETWAPYAAFIAEGPADRGTMVGDLDADGLDDLVWGAPGRVCTARNDGQWSFTVRTYGAPAWPLVPNIVIPGKDDAFRVADVNGDGKADVLRYSSDMGSRLCWGKLIHEACADSLCTAGLCTWIWADGAATQVLVGDGQGGFTATDPQYPYVGNGDFPHEPWGRRTSLPYLRDVSGDGRADLVWVEPGTTTARVLVAAAETDVNNAFVRFGTPPSSAELGAADLPPGVTSWANFRGTFADVNGDGKVDVVLSDESTTASLYVLIR